MNPLLKDVAMKEAEGQGQSDNNLRKDYNYIFF